jgi:hypothetical protein
MLCYVMLVCMDKTLVMYGHSVLCNLGHSDDETCMSVCMMKSRNADASEDSDVWGAEGSSNGEKGTGSCGGSDGVAVSSSMVGRSWTSG